MTTYRNPKATNLRKYDYTFGKGKYSYSMILHSAQTGTLLIYLNKNQITEKNLNELEKVLSRFGFITDIFGIEYLKIGIKGNFIIMET